MSKTLRIFTLKRKVRGNKAVRNSAGVASLNAYLLPSNEVVDRGVLKRRYRTEKF